MKTLIIIIGLLLILFTDARAKDLEIELEPAWEKTAVYFEGKSNLPEGTQLDLVLFRSGKKTAVGGDAYVVIRNQKFKSKSFVGKEAPLQGKYRVRLMAYFSNKQLGDYSSPYLKLENPDLVDSDKVFHYEKEFDLQPKIDEAETAIQIVKGFYLVRDGKKSAWTVAKSLDDFVEGLEIGVGKSNVKRSGWRAVPVEGNSGVYNVYYTYDYVEKPAAPKHCESWFECDVTAKQVRCRNKAAYDGWVQ